MLAARSAAARASLMRAVGVRALSEAAVPIHEVARVIRFKVTGEESALAADAAFQDSAAAIKALPGFVKVTRQLCKTEWVHESSIVFDSLDNFKSYMGSEGTEKALVTQVQGIAVDGEVYLGARVHDEFTL